MVITADNDGSPNTVGGTAPEDFPGNNQFYLIVDFNVDIGTASNEPLQAGEFTHALVNALNASVSSNTSGNGAEVIFGDPTVVSTDASKFKVPITIDPDSDATDDPQVNEAIPTGTAGTPLEELTLRIRVNLGAVTSAAVNLTDPNETNPVNAVGQLSYQSSIYEFVLVNTLPESDPPRLSYSPNPQHLGPLGPDKQVTFKLILTDVSGIPTTGPGAFTAEDLTPITGGTMVSFKGPTGDTTFGPNTTVYELVVTATAPDIDFGIKPGSVTDAAPVPNPYTSTGTVGWSLERDVPTLAITHTPADNTAVGNDGMVTFTFTFADASGIVQTGEDAFTKSDIKVTGGAKGDFAGSGLVYTLKVTPTNPYTDVKVAVAAGAVKDASLRKSALAATEGTWTAPAAPVPTLTVSHSPADNINPTSGKVTFTFVASVPLATSGAGEFTSSDIIVSTGAVKSGFTKIPATGTAKEMYTVDVLPEYGSLNQDGTNGQYENVTVAVAAGAVTSIYGIASTAPATGDLTWIAEDTTKPTVAITSSPGDGLNVGASGTVVFTFRFSEPLGSNDAGFTNDDIAVTGHTGIPAFAGSGLVYTYTVTPANPKDPAGVTVTVGARNVSDAVGNAIADTSYTWKPLDETAPTVAIGALKGSLTVGTGANAVTYTGIVFTFTFSEELRTSGAGAFTSEDITRSTGVDLLSNVEMDASDKKVYRVVTTQATVTRLTIRAGTVCRCSW